MSFSHSPENQLRIPEDFVVFTLHYMEQSVLFGGSISVYLDEPFT